MGKPWAYLGDDGKWHLTPEEAEICRVYREKSKKNYEAFLKRANKIKEERRKNDHPKPNPATN